MSNSRDHSVQRFRQWLFWTHLAAGLLAGAIVFIMAVSGVLLAYQKQLTVWADMRGLNGAAPASMLNATPLPPDELLTRVSATDKATATGIVWRSGGATPVEIQFGRERRVFVNAYTAQVLGSGSATTRGFFRKVTDWHRWLAGAGDRRAWGKAITGAANLAFLPLVLSGIWLWWPKQWNRRALRNVTWFRGGLSGKARDFNWHTVIGFWSALPLALIVASGVVISYGWAGDLVYRLVGEAPPSRAEVRGLGPAVAAVATVPRATLSLQLAVAKAQMSSWQSVSVTLPTKPGADAAFTVDRGMGGEPQKRATVFVAPHGRITTLQTFDSQSTGRKLRSMLRFAHTGELLGLPGQMLAGLLSLGSAVLVFTGIALSLRRLRSWLRRRKTGADERQLTATSAA